MNDERGPMDLERQIENLKKRVEDLESINTAHQHLNGQLRDENFKLKQQVGSKIVEQENLLHGYKKLIEDLSNKLSRKDS